MLISYLSHFFIFTILNVIPSVFQKIDLSQSQNIFKSKKILSLVQAITHSLFIGYLDICRSVDSVIPGMHWMNLVILTSLIILFQRFSTPPTIFVTASHQFPKRPQDAMAVWVEELRADNFKICLRETKISMDPIKA